MTTNNSINTPKPIDVSSGGTGVASTTAYGVLAGGTSSTSAFQNIGTGSSGQVLTSNGAGALPSFQAAAGGGDVVLLSSQAMTGVNSITFNNFVDNTVYNSYKVEMWGISSTNNDIYMQISTDNGSTFVSSGYAYASFQYNSTNSPQFFNAGSSTSDTKIFLGFMWQTAISSYILSFMPFGESVASGGQGLSDFYFPGGTKQIIDSSWYSGTTNANAFKIYTQNATNWTAGTACLYGYKK